MRWLAFCFLVSTLVSAQDLPRVDVSPDRLIIEVIPVHTLGAKMAQGEVVVVEADYDAELEKVNASIGEALAVLGVRQDEYEVQVWSDESLTHDLMIACDIFARWKSAVGIVLAGRTLPDAINCHSRHGAFTTESESFNATTAKLVETFKGHAALQLGRVYLFAILAPDELRWPGTAGNAIVYNAVSPESQFPYLNEFCTAFAVNRPIVIAHELGHCFGLSHNTGRGRNDLMYHSPNRAFRLNDSNKEIVRQHFSGPVPVPALSMADPQ